MEHNGSDADLARQYQVSCKYYNDHNSDLLHKVFDAVIEKAGLTGRHLILCHLILYLFMTLCFHRFPNERFYDQDRIDQADDTVVLRLTIAAHLPSEPL
ncbi:hypothetical protein D9M68_671440 [compost metagenome]